MFRVPMHDIVLATGHHPLDAELVSQLAADLVADLEFDTLPVRVLATNGDRFALLDGRHRFAANLIAGRPDLAVVLDV